jgi:hypothetical protein
MSISLARTYAPVFFHKINSAWRVADQIAPLDFSGSIRRLQENPVRLNDLHPDDTKTLKPVIYTSICETPTHFFILYAVYHIIDWWKRFVPDLFIDRLRFRLDNHFHDMEGALLVVTKHPKNLVDAVFTVSHNHFYLYTEPVIYAENGTSRPVYPDISLKISKFQETVDGHIRLEPVTKRVVLYIESNGHGIRCDQGHWGRGEEIWAYWPKGCIPEEIREGASRGILKSYSLEHIFRKDGLWDHRFNNEVFRQDRKGKWGFVFRTRKGETRISPANPPWSWDDRNDPSPIGEIATDPARFILRYAQGWGPVSTQYLVNPYMGISRSSRRH